MAYGIDIPATFTLHPPTEEQRRVYDILGNAYTAMAEFVDTNVPLSAEQTLALRKLQESMMYSYAAVAMNGPRVH